MKGIPGSFVNKQKEVAVSYHFASKLNKLFFFVNVSIAVEGCMHHTDVPGRVRAFPRHVISFSFALLKFYFKHYYNR